MKTITLTTEAYERLAAWKESPRDSFSKVVDRLVPARGTLGGIRAAVDGLPNLTAQEEKKLEAAVRSLNDWSKQADPWTI